MRGGGKAEARGGISLGLSLGQRCGGSLRLPTPGWDERGCPFYRLSADEFERMRNVARQAGERHAGEAARLDAEQAAAREAVVAEDLERRKRKDPFGEVAGRTRGRPR